MSFAETPIVFDCLRDKLVGVLHHGAPGKSRGVLIVVGGPQYRVGSHREFVTIARRIAADGTPVFRFDVRGMGDSTGDHCGFEGAEADIEAAMNCFMKHSPSLENVVLLGLCDGASASLIYSCQDRRVSGLILWNPWIRSLSGRSRYVIRHYYLPRSLQVSVWKAALSEKHKIRSAIKDIALALGRSMLARLKTPLRKRDTPPDFVDRMKFGMEQFAGPVLLLISGNDLVGKEFLEYADTSDEWRKAKQKGQVSLSVFPEANHTMTKRRDLNAAVAMCLTWLSERQL